MKRFRHILHVCLMLAALLPALVPAGIWHAHDCDSSAETQHHETPDAQSFRSHCEVCAHYGAGLSFRLETPVQVLAPAAPRPLLTCTVQPAPVRSLPAATLRGPPAA